MISIDIGSNTLKVAYLENGKLKNLDEVLNLGLFYQNQEISEEGIAILEKALDKLNARFNLKDAKVVATAVFRKSKNTALIAQRLFLKYGFSLKILSQEEEARLTRLGVGLSEVNFTLVDIGGYSSEISDNFKKLFLDIGLLSFYKDYQKQNLSLEQFSKKTFDKYKESLSEFKPPIVLASKTGIYAKSIKEGKKYDEIDDLDYHNAKISKSDLSELIRFLEENDKKTNELYVGKNRDFAVLCGAYIIKEMFSEDEFIITSFGLKEGVLFSKDF